MKPFEVASLLTEGWHSHLELRQFTLRNAFFDKLKQEYSGLVRPQLETYLYEHLGIDHVSESHRVLIQLMVSKLKAKTGHASVINKALQAEHKVIYKFKDIEDTLVKGLASDSLMRRLSCSEVMKTIDQLALKAKEPKPLSKKKQRDSSPGTSPKKPKK